MATLEWSQRPPNRSSPCTWRTTWVRLAAMACQPMCHVLWAHQYKYRPMTSLSRVLQVLAKRTMMIIGRHLAAAISRFAFLMFRASPKRELWSQRFIQPISCGLCCSQGWDRYGPLAVISCFVYAWSISFLCSYFLLRIQSRSYLRVWRLSTTMPARCRKPCFADESHFFMFMMLISHVFFGGKHDSWQKKLEQKTWWPVKTSCVGCGGSYKCEGSFAKIPKWHILSGMGVAQDYVDSQKDFLIWSKDST